jgi:hypothetical protein
LVEVNPLCKKKTKKWKYIMTILKGPGKKIGELSNKAGGMRSVNI